MKIIDYKGFEIEYYEFEDKFTIKSNYDIKKQTLSEVKDYIDRITKKDFKRFNVLVRAYNYKEGYQEAEVTSITEEGDYWIVYKDGQREKKHKSGVFVLNENNVKLIKEISELRKNVGELNTKINTLENNMEKINETKI